MRVWWTARTAAALALVAWLVPACTADGGGESTDEPVPTTIAEVGGDVERFAAYLETRPGVAEATGEVVELDTDYYGWEARVVLAADAPPDTVAETLQAAEQFEQDAAYHESGEVYLSREGTDHELWWREDAVPGLADAFLRAEERLAELPWVLDGYGQFRVAGLEATGAITDVVRRVAADEQLAGHGWLVTTTEFAEVVANPGTRVLQALVLDDEVVDAWADVARATDDLEHLDLSLLQLVPAQPPGSYSADPPPEGSVHLNIEVDAGNVRRPELSRDPLSAELRRLVASTVEALARLPLGSEYSLAVLLGDSESRQVVELVQLTSDREDAGRYDDTLAGHAQELLDRFD